MEAEGIRKEVDHEFELDMRDEYFSKSEKDSESEGRKDKSEHD